jgi:prepilin-type N-terminal cleavage/methylation domain-containing protein
VVTACPRPAARCSGALPSRWKSRRPAGFTLIELLVVLAILALLLTIATPKYIQHIERAREATLRSTLKVMRESIDKFSGDQGRFPVSLDELVSRDYLKAVPLDPITEKRDTWIVLTEAELRTAASDANTGSADAPSQAPGSSRPPAPGVASVRSGATGKSTDGTPYQNW